MDVRTSAGAKVPHAEFFPPPPTPRGPSLWLAQVWPRTASSSCGSGRSSRTWSSRSCEVRYQRSILGFLWTLLNPLLMLATLCLVFSHLFKRH